jgi:APA family basic amino acid/polyamine antiporter
MSKPPVQLERSLSEFDIYMLNVGSIVGSGIFLVSSSIARAVPEPGLQMFTWIVAGFFSLCGALAVAELGAAMPQAGGSFVYLKEAFGPLLAFFYGWTVFAAIQTASIAALGVGAAIYIGYFIPLTPFQVQLVAVANIAVLTVINVLGVREGAFVQNLLTILKVAAIAGLVALAFATGGGSPDNLLPLWPEDKGLPLGAFGVALVAALWAYDGWIHTAYVAGEIQKPHKTIPRAMLTSMITVCAIYILASSAYVYTLGSAAVAASERVASDTAVSFLGQWGGAFVALAVIISATGANNGAILAGARVYYAMSEAKVFFPAFADVHPKFKTPAKSLVLQSVWSIALVFTGTYDQLFTYVVYGQWLFYLLAVAAVFVLRRTRPELERPYRTWGYPITPLLFIGFAAYIIFNTFTETPRDAVIGTGLIFLGLPAYWYYHRRR